MKFTEEQIASFTEDQENANTKKKTVSDLKLFNEFLNSEEEERNIENIPAAELQQLAKKFVLGVRKKNGEEYEPSSLRGFLQSVDRYLRKKGCTFSLLNDKEFCEVQEILKKKQKQLKHGAILYNGAEVFSLSITNPNGRPMLPFDWLIHSSLILASCHRFCFCAGFLRLRNKFEN